MLTLRTLFQAAASVWSNGPLVAHCMAERRIG
jgi:hypothetical protein